MRKKPIRLRPESMTEMLEGEPSSFAFLTPAAIA
jgi:hypothetical protein